VITKIISRQESQQILRNLYRKEALEKHATALNSADPQERARLLEQIEREVEQRVRKQKTSAR